MSSILGKVTDALKSPFKRIIGGSQPATQPSPVKSPPKNAKQAAAAAVEKQDKKGKKKGKALDALLSPPRLSQPITQDYTSENEDDKLSSSDEEPPVPMPK